MRIVVCVKQVYDPATVRISRSREELDLRGATRITNPPDRYALEAALRLRAAGGGEVVALTAGDAQAEDAAHEAVAIGADRAILLTGDELAAAGGGAIARTIAAAVERLAPVDLVLTGQIGLVDGTGGLAGRLAALLGWPLALDVVRLSPAGDRTLDALVAGDARGAMIRLTAPAVASIAPGDGRPRYPHAARIANAWKPGTVEICTAAELGLGDEVFIAETQPGALILAPERTRGQVLSGSVEAAAAGLLDLLAARRLVRGS